MTAIAAIHAGLRQLGIEQDDARDLYERQTGKRSLREMTSRQHDTIVEELRRLGFRKASKAGSKPLQGPFAGKLQAQWIALYNLGLVTDKSDKALLAFVKRQTKLDHVNFLRDPREATKVIDALKAWMTRAGVEWRHPVDAPAWQREPGAKIAMAQWVILGGEPMPAGFPAFRKFVEEYSFNTIAQMSHREWAGAMNRLGERVRKQKALRA